MDSTYNSRYSASAVLFLGCVLAAVNTQAAPASNIDNAFRPPNQSEPDFGDKATLPTKASVKVDVQVLPPVNFDEMEKSDTAVILVKSISVQGNSVLSEEEVRGVAAPYIGRQVSAAELQELRLLLSQRYAQKGYINSGALLPDQDIKDGAVVFKVIEGSLTKIEINENKNDLHLRESYIKKRIEREVDKPLNTKELQTALQLLQQNPLIGTVRADLHPGDELGEAILKLQVEEARAWDLSLRTDNYNSPSVGAVQNTLNFTHRNLTGFGDEISLSANRSEKSGAQYASLNYSIPLNRYDTRLSLAYSKSNSKVIEKPLDELEIENDSEYRSLMLHQPLVQRLDRHIEIFTGFVQNHSESKLLGELYPLSLGSDNGVSETDSVQLGGEWIERWSDRLIALRGTFRKGLDSFDATKQVDNLPSGEYSAFVGQLQFINRVGRWGDVRLRSSVQNTSDNLLSIEQFAVGGRYTVRGYRENLLVRDNGLLTSLEYHLPLAPDAQGISQWGVQLIPFIDYGSSWDNALKNNLGDELRSDKKESILSYGLGLQWNFKSWLQLETYYGKAQDETAKPLEHNAQDDGWHIGLTLSWPSE